MIDSYDFGEFIINGKSYRSNVILLGESVKPARHLEEHKIMLDDLLPLVNYAPEYIVIGTGAAGVMSFPKELADYIQKVGIKLIVKKTGEACQEYDYLLKQKKKVAAFMHNTC